MTVQRIVSRGLDDAACAAQRSDTPLWMVFIGALAIHAGLTQQPDEAGGLREVWQGIAAQPFGAWLLGAMGTGLMAFGLYCLNESAFREIDGPGDG